MIQISKSKRKISKNSPKKRQISEKSLTNWAAKDQRTDIYSRRLTVNLVTAGVTRRAELQLKLNPDTISTSLE